MQTIVVILLFILGVFFIVKGSDLLIEACFLLSDNSGISKLIIGATLVSLATALPEITVSLIAIIKGFYDLAVGNAIGSMICNICLVLGAGVLLSPQKVDLKDFFNKGVLLLFLNIFLFVIAFNYKIEIFESIVLIIIFVLFFKNNFDEAKGSFKNKQLKTNKVNIKSYVIIFIQFSISCIAIFIGSNLIVQKGTLLADILNINKEITGFTIVAFSTSLPELVTTIVAIKKRSLELAFGNIVGANIINITLLFGLGGIIAKGLFISNQAKLILMPFLIFVTTFLILPILISKKTYRFQGFILIIVYLLYSIFILSTRIVYT